jgi:hypothetical protein
VPLKQYVENACAVRRDLAEPGLRQEIEQELFREHGYVRHQGDWVPKDEVPFLEWQVRATTAGPATTDPAPTEGEGVPANR